MRKRTTALVLAGALATGGVGVAVAGSPASAATTDTASTSRLDAIKNALKGLVGDGTLTQDQADKVAGTLDEALPERRGMGGRFGERMSETLDAAASTLGMTAEQLRTALRDGKTLADVAEGENVSVDDLVESMVAVAEKELDTAVEDGKITQERAEEMKSSLTQRITDRVNGVRGERGHGHGRRGEGGGPSADTDKDSSPGTTSGSSTSSSVSA